MSRVLVDSSAWIDFFRGRADTRPREFVAIARVVTVLDLL